MLVLGRREGEQIYIGDDITLTVVRISNGHVRLGIEAPIGVPIHRDDMKTGRADRDDDVPRST